MEPNTEWKYDEEQLLKKTKHKVELAGITLQLSKLLNEPYSLNDALKASPATDSFYNLDAKEKKKVNLSFFML